MADFSHSEPDDTTVAGSHPELDRPWWGEPDPVEVFAANLELALRQLRIEVAGLRAERDGLRLEVESLRARLALAQEQLATRDNLAHTVHELRAVIARLTIGAAAPAVAPVAPAPIAPESTFWAGSASEPVADPAQNEPAPTPVAAPRTPEPSALEQLRAMGVWPPKAATTTAPATAPAPPAPEAPAAPAAPATREPLAPPRVAPSPTGTTEPVIHWDTLSNRALPVLADDERERIDVPDGLEADRPARFRRLTKVLSGLLITLGTVGVVAVMLVSLGPRLLPYQTYFVRSGSMEPTIDTGGLVVLKKANGDTLAPGDIITFKNPNDESVLVTHRIVDIETTDQGKVFVTKGDANTEPDPWRVPAAGAGWKYWFDIPIAGYVFGYLGTPQARLLLLGVPGMVLALMWLRDLWRKDKP
jgi:signal peptidase